MEMKHVTTRGIKHWSHTLHEKVKFLTFSLFKFDQELDSGFSSCLLFIIKFGVKNVNVSDSGGNIKESLFVLNYVYFKR